MVRAYLAGHRLDRDQIRLMRRYLEQWFDSPVWADAGASRPWALHQSIGELEALRQKVHEIQTNEDIRAVLEDALDLGIDPL